MSSPIPAACRLTPGHRTTKRTSLTRQHFRRPRHPIRFSGMSGGRSSYGQNQSRSRAADILASRPPAILLQSIASKTGGQVYSPAAIPHPYQAADAHWGERDAAASCHRSGDIHG